MKKNAVLMQIGELAQQTKTPIDTIRYYEKETLLEKPKRSDGGYRLYSNEAVERLKFIRKAQQLGLTLSEIREIIGCSREGLGPCCALVRELFEKKIQEFEIKISELSRMKRNIEKLLSEWVPMRDAKKKPYAVCPQIERSPKKKRRR